MREVPFPDLSNLTTIGLGGRGRVLFILESWADLTLLPEKLEPYRGEAFVLGKGSNLLPQDGDHPLVLVQVASFDEPHCLGDDGDKVLVEVGAGYGLQPFLHYCASHGLGGLEGLVGIPGSIGGAIAMNAGSFGCAVCEHLCEVTVWQDNAVRIFGPTQFQYGYRKFAFAGSTNFFIVLKAIFCLTKVRIHDINSRMHLNFLKKKSNQPVSARSAGCVFKNPEGYSAGRLLEECGFKGQRLGGVCFSDLHANFLLNDQKGTASQALELISKAEECVYRERGIILEREVRVVPCLKK